ncbi:MAG: hypothetical protein RSG77_05530 [Hafnia sp.]
MTHACKISEVIERLLQHQHDDFVLCSLWYEDDVRNVDASATDEEVRKALQHEARNHDAEQGINWDTPEAALHAIRQ